MKTLELEPNQIITLNDYPVHSDDVLRDYFNQIKGRKEMPLVPVIRKSIVRGYFVGKMLEEFEAFERSAPTAEYFMLDGSHRTTALTLTRHRIKVVIYDRDEDIAEARKLVGTGKILKSEILDHTVDENCEILNMHFQQKPYFMTVRQKTEKMIRENVLPKDMTVYY
jgi:hypothetical protein